MVSAGDDPPPIAPVVQPVPDPVDTVTDAPAPGDRADLADLVDLTGTDEQRARRVSLVPAPRPERLDLTEREHELRRGDVDAYGRSENMRALARRLYDPMYRYWFRAEWEGLEHIPAREAHSSCPTTRVRSRPTRR